MDRRGPGRLDPRKVVGYLFVAGMVIAPFLALAFSFEFGLTVMAVTLGATTYLAFDALGKAQPQEHSRLHILAIVNAVLCMLCVTVLLLRIS